MSQSLQTTKKERLSFSFYFLGQGFIYTICAQHLMFFYTEYAFIPPLVISIVLFFEKVWDGINDVLFGIIMEKVKFKSGHKFLPWIKMSTILLPISTIALFSIQPGIPLFWRVVLVIVTYAIWAMAYTICDAPAYALSTAVTSDVKERGLVMTFSSVGGTVAAGLATIVLVPFYTNYGFFTTAIVISVIAFMAMSMLSSFAKERYHFDHKGENKSSLKEIWLYLKQNRYLQIFYLYRLITGSIALQTVNYVAKYCFGNLNYVVYIAASSIIPIIILYSLSQKLLKRFDKIQLLRVSVMISMGLYTLNLFLGYGQSLIYICLMAGVAVMAIIPSILFGTMPSDCIEYMTFKKGIRKEGITFSLQSCIAKTCSAFAGVLTGVVLSIVGYEGGAAVLSQAATHNLWIFSCIVPIVGLGIGLYVLKFYHLKDSDVQLMANANAGLITKEEATAQLSREYD